VNLITAAQEVVGYTPPSTVSPGYPPATVLEHTGDGCGCGGTCGGTQLSTVGAVVSPVPSSASALTPPRFLQASMLQTPADFQPPPLTGGNTMFGGIDFSNWRADWWKYVAGALAYKLLSK